MTFWSSVHVRFRGKLKYIYFCKAYGQKSHNPSVIWSHPQIHKATWFLEIQAMWGHLVNKKWYTLTSHKVYYYQTWQAGDMKYKATTWRHEVILTWPLRNKYRYFSNSTRPLATKRRKLVLMSKNWCSEFKEHKI